MVRSSSGFTFSDFLWIELMMDSKARISFRGTFEKSVPFGNHLRTMRLTFSTAPNAIPTTSPMASSPRQLRYILGGGLGNVPVLRVRVKMIAVQLNLARVLARDRKEGHMICQKRAFSILTLCQKMAYRDLILCQKCAIISDLKLKERT